MAGESGEGSGEDPCVPWEFCIMYMYYLARKKIILKNIQFYSLCLFMSTGFEIRI